MKNAIQLVRPVTELMMMTVCLAGEELISLLELVMDQAHVNVTFSTTENPMLARRSAQIFTVKHVNRFRKHTCVSNVKKDITSVKMDTVTNVLTPMTATSSSRQRLSHVPVTLANTGTEPAAVVIVPTTALTAPLSDPNIVALVISDTSSLRTLTPVLTSAQLDSSKPVLLKSATVMTS